MRTLLIPGHTHLFAGSESQHQSTLALDTAFRLLPDGWAIVALVDAESEGEAFRSRARLWLRAQQHNPAHNANVTFVKDWRHIKDGEALADVIRSRFKTIEQDEDFPLTGLVVFYDAAAEMLPTQPDAPIFDKMTDALAFLEAMHILPNVLTVMTAHTGNPYLPPTPLATYPADRVFDVQAPGIAIRIKVAQIKPTREPPFVLEGRIVDGGTITLEEQESENV